MHIFIHGSEGGTEEKNYGVRVHKPRKKKKSGFHLIWEGVFVCGCFSYLGSNEIVEQFDQLYGDFLLAKSKSIIGQRWPEHEAS